MTAATTTAREDANPPAVRAIDTLAGTAAITCLSIVTTIGFCRVFAGWEFLRPMLLVVITIHLVSLALRLLSVSGYIAVPIAVLALFELIAWKYYPSSLSGPFPTSTTWRFMSADLHLARDQFPSAVAPVAAVGGFVIAAAAASGVAALLSDAFAFRAYGRAEAAVPNAVLFVFAAALGVDNHRVTLTAAWLVAALVVIATLRMTHSRVEHAWIGRPARVVLSVVPLVGLLAGCAALGGAVLGPRLPGAGEKALLDTRDRNTVTQVLSPLVDIRSRLINLKNTELFTVDSAEPHYWRATGLSLFNGTTWGIPEGTEGGDFQSAPASTRELRQTVHILGLAGPLLPAAYGPVGASGGDVYFVPLTGTLVEPGAGLKRGATYSIVSAVSDLTPDQLRTATSSGPSDPMSLDLPAAFPSSVRDLAQQITADGTTVYDKSFALEQYFRTNFTYDLTVQRGHSDNALENFLRIKRGYCEQFSAAFAAMARSVGIPARVAVGFTYGDLGPDDKYHVFGRNAHAWPEVWFDQYGWVAFEPTPGRGQPGAEAYTGAPAAQALPDDSNSDGTSDSVPGPAAPTTTTTTPAGATGGPTTTIFDPDATPTTTRNPLQRAAVPDKGVSGWSKLFFALLVLAGAWAFALPRLVRARSRRRAAETAPGRIRQSWERAVHALDLLDLAPDLGETPIEHARRVEKMTGMDRRMLRELAAAATAAIYGDVGDDVTSLRCELHSANIVGAVRDRLTTTNRFLAYIDPRRASVLVTG
jgi:transglutaminase-like putative cysteine protease